MKHYMHVGVCSGCGRTFRLYCDEVYTPRTFIKLECAFCQTAIELKLVQIKENSREL